MAARKPPTGPGSARESEPPKAARRSLRCVPTLEEEERLVLGGHTVIAGLDEAGRGCLAGSVEAAAAILPLAEDCIRLFAGVRDSKQISEAQRERLYAVILERAVGIGVGIISAQVIDRTNILRAT